MTVKELIERLSRISDQDLPIVTYANGHSYHSEWSRNTHGPLQIGIYHRGSDDKDNRHEAHGVIIGNMRRLRFNYPNDWVIAIVDVDGGTM